MARETVVFHPGDPDAETGVAPIVILNDGPALLCAAMKLTIGMRKGGGEDLLLSLSTAGGSALFAAFTPVTARALADGLTEWAAAQEAAAGDAAASALQRAGGRE